MVKPGRPEEQSSTLAKRRSSLCTLEGNEQPLALATSHEVKLAVYTIAGNRASPPRPNLFALIPSNQTPNTKVIHSTLALPFSSPAALCSTLPLLALSLSLSASLKLHPALLSGSRRHGRSSGLTMAAGEVSPSDPCVCRAVFSFQFVGVFVTLAGLVARVS